VSSLEKPSPSQPPSEPQRQRNTGTGAGAGSAPSSLGTSRLTETAADALLGGDRPARLQMIAALVLGLVLVAIPLYLWRRPRSEAVTVTSEAQQAASAASAASAAAALSGPNAANGAGGANGAARASDADSVLLSEARVLECHDPGSKHTAATDCDHLASIKKALAQAIKDNASCLPTAAGGGTLVYVVDVSFQRKRNPVALTVPKDGRALRSATVAGSPKASAAAANACAGAVKHALSGVSLDGLPHQHARYKIAITATYNAK